MDAGVPLKAAVAGIAMGLIYAEGKYLSLTDILGAEDAFGDMDFKVAGTADAVTALQLDTNIDGIPADVLAAALEQAKEARLKILDVMNAAISKGRDTVAESAPKIISINDGQDTSLGIFHKPAFNSSNRHDANNAVVVDSNVGAGLLLDGVDDLALRSDDFTDLVHGDVDRDDLRS